MQDPETKQLRENTDPAIEGGLNGSPRTELPG